MSVLKVLSDPKNKGQRIGYILYSFAMVGFIEGVKYFSQMFLHIFFIIPKGEIFKLI